MKGLVKGCVMATLQVSIKVNPDHDLPAKKGVNLSINVMGHGTDLFLYLLRASIPLNPRDRYIDRVAC